MSTRVKIKPYNTRVCSVCGNQDLDMGIFKTQFSLNEHTVMKKNTSQLLSVVNTKAKRNNKVMSLF